MTGLALRPATLADSEFCFQLHKAAMGGYITAIWGWDERRQRGFHARGFDPGRWQIITDGGADIGMLDVEYRPAEIYLSRIEVHPAVKAAASAPGSSTRPGKKARTSSLTCSPSTPALMPSTSGSA